MAASWGASAVGATAANMQILDAEMARVATTGGLVYGSGTSGSVSVNGIQAASSNPASAVVTIQALADNSAITFLTGASVFNALAAQADNGVLVKADVTGDTKYGCACTQLALTPESPKNVAWVHFRVQPGPGCA